MKKNIIWFTIIELLVVIAIIMVITIWLSRMNYNPQINNQKFLEFNNQITSNIEALRNNALIWKWVWLNLDTPNSWLIEISTWALSTSYYSWATKVWYKLYDVNFNNLNQIKNFECNTITWATLSTTTSKVEILINWNTIDLTWACNQANAKILEINTQSSSFSWTIKLNTVTWIVEKK